MRISDWSSDVCSSDLSQYEFPSDSSASILTSGLLGEQYIGITPGGDDKMLKQNSEIQYTQSAVVLEELISKFLYSSANKEGSASSESNPGQQPADANAAGANAPTHAKP